MLPPTAAAIQEAEADIVTTESSKARHSEEACSSEAEVTTPFYPQLPRVQGVLYQRVLASDLGTFLRELRCGIWTSLLEAADLELLRVLGAQEEAPRRGPDEV